MKKKSKRLLVILFSLCSCFSVWGQEMHSVTKVDSTVWYVHFEHGRSELKLDFNGNQETLESFVAKVNLIMGSESSSVTGIRIIGYASPEGPLELNQRLSRERADALLEYLMTNTGLSADKFEVIAGGENWGGFRLMVEEGNLPNKEKILEIISSGQTKEEKERELKRLPDGIYSYLLENYYPRLRSAGSIQMIELHPIVTKTAVVPKEEPTAVVEVQEAVSPAPQKPIIMEEPCRCEPPFLGISTNLAYWAAGIIPNIQLETYFTRRYSVTLEGVYRWPKDRFAKGNNMNVAYISPEVRYFLLDDASYAGHYFGAYGQYGEFDLKLGDTGRQGYARGGGISYGYIFRFHRVPCLYFDLGVSAGYLSMNFDRYYWYDPCNAFNGHNGHQNYWGFTKMKASLVWRF